MKKIVAILLVLLVASASFTFACEHTQNSTDCWLCSANSCANSTAAVGGVVGGYIGATAAGAIASTVVGAAAGGVAGFLDGLDGECGEP